MARSQAIIYGKSMLGALRYNLNLPSYRYRQVRKKCEWSGIVIGLYRKEGDKDARLSANGETFDDRVEGKISELVKESNMDGTLGQGRMFSNVDKEFSTVAVVGLGQEGAGFDEEEMLDVGMENVRIAAAVGARALQLQGAQTVYVDSMEYPEQAAEGAALAVWRFNANKEKSHRVKVPQLEMYGASDVDAWTRGLFKAEGQNLARRLADAPPNQMTPSIFAKATIDALCACGVSVEVRSMDWIEAQSLNSFLMIAKGSCEPPVILEISYSGGSAEDRPIVLLGKGLTFNSGGLCLKPKKTLHEQRGAVCGAAACVGAIRAAAALSLPLSISALIPLCENMPSGMAAKPGDVVTLINGKKLCMKDASNVGNVMLADPILYAQGIHKPKLLIDVGSFTKGVECGLGASSTGLWTNNSMLWKQFQKAGSLTGDRVWRMPLWRHFRDLIEPNISYDICNKGRGPATSCLTAALLHSLVPCTDWVHLDTKGTGLLAKHGVPPYLLKDSMTGRPTRTLIQFLYQIACSS